MQRRPFWLALAAACVSLEAGAAHRASPDLTSMPLEQLLSMEVYSASKFVQRASQAPSSVTVISAAEIRDFGWRTLADVARSVRGLSVNHDRNYSYLGERGFLRPGDYNTRFLLQVDGNRINDSVYDQAPLGGEFPLDLDLIERIEFVPGPGSSIYGSNAFFGVINVITKKGSDQPGARAAVELGAAGWRRASASQGWHGANGAQYLVALSRLAAAGADLYYPEFDTPGQNHGVARDLDFERTTRLFASASQGAMTATVMHAERAKGTPTASFAQPFNDPRSRIVDRQTYLNAAWRSHFGEHEELTARVFAGHYASYGNYIINDAARSLTRDGSTSNWWGVELNLLSTRRASHTLLAGLDLQHDYRLHQYSYAVAPFYSYLDQRRSARRIGVYVQDELVVSDALRLNLGLRYDHSDRVHGGFNPRAALIYQLGPATTVKAIHGTAFRAPNSYELHYRFDGEGGQLDNPDLHQERIRSSELAFSHLVGPSARLTATAFHNSVSGLITQSVEPHSGLTRFENMRPLNARGAEVEYEQNWTNGVALRTSYSWSRTASDAHQQVNAPRHLAKLNAALPLPVAGMRGALEAQYVGPRRALLGVAEGYWLANLNLLCTRVRNLDIALGVFNLFDRRYADPGSTEHMQAVIAQDGRRVRLRVAYAF